MPEIGESLREARTRQRIEIAQMETQTKIRAKYLRALENEEWELLPGPTYIKSFLRTYGDMLGLDGRGLVADYKRGHEPFVDSEDLGQIPKHSRPRSAPSSRRPTRTLVTGGVVLVLVAAAVGYALVRGDDEPSGTTPSGASGGADEPDRATQVPVGTEPVTVVVRPTADVTICARAGSRQIIPEKELGEGERSAQVRGRSVVVTLTARRAQVTVNGEREPLPGSGTGPLTFVATDQGLTEAPAEITGCRS